MGVQFQSLAGAVVRFSGLHPESVVGADLKAAGVTIFAENTGNLFAMLRRQNELERYNNRTLLALQLKREPNNPQDPNAIGVYATINGKPKQLGFVPASVTRGIAPLMDAGHDFAATLTRLTPFQIKGKRHYQPTFRLEYLAKTNQEPLVHMREQVESVFIAAREQEPGGFNRVLNIVPEAVNTYQIRGKRLVERINEERGEATYYLDGQSITRVKLDPTRTVTPAYQRPNVPKSIRDKVAQLVNIYA